MSPGDEMTEARLFLIRCLKNTFHPKALGVIVRLEFNMIDEKMARSLREWEKMYTGSKVIEKNIQQFGEGPAGVNQIYVMERGLEALLTTQKRANDILDDLLS